MALTQKLPTTDNINDSDIQSEDEEDPEEPLNEDLDDFDHEEAMEILEGGDVDAELPSGIAI